jgi:alcohol dehydrogenase
LAEAAIQLVGQFLARAVEHPDDTAARDGMALAATYAGLAFSNCGVALVHGLEYPLGGALHCTHGAGNGLLLPHVMRFLLPNCMKPYARVAELLGSDIRGLTEKQAAERAIEAVDQLRERIGVPGKIRELGGLRDQLPGFAVKSFAIKRLLETTPRPATEADLLAILEAAY